MTRQTSIRFTEATDRQINSLAAAGFGTTADIIRIAIDRMYQQEQITMTATQRPAHLYLDTSDDAMFGSATPPENADDLRKTFVTMVERELSDVFPEIDLEVVEVNHGQRVVFFDAPQDDDDDTAETIINVMARIYGQMAWAENA